MPASTYRLIYYPTMFLICSFVFGALIDMCGEQIGAQEQTNQFFIKHAKPIRLPSTQDKNQDPQQSPSDIPVQAPYPTQQSPTGDEIGVAQDYFGLKIMDIDMIVLDPSERRPQDRSNDLIQEFYHSNYPGSFQDRLAMWCPPNIRYQPLYFEDVRLERYGQTCGPIVQPVVSAAHYAASFTLLAYNLWHEKPGNCVYPLGYCRPGSLAPNTMPRFLWAKH